MHKLKYFSLLMMIFATVSCSNGQTDNFSVDLNEYTTFQSAKEGLLNDLNNSNLNLVNKKAIELGIYKPMYSTNACYLTKAIYPFKTTYLTNLSFDVNNFIFVSSYISREDKDSLLAKNFQNKADAENYLTSLGYTIKNEVTLRLSDYLYPSVKDEYLAQSFLNRSLYKENSKGEYVEDIVSSLTKASESTYLLKIKEDIYWKDFDGNNVRKFVSKDIVPTSFAKTFFKNIYFTNDSNLYFETMEPSNVNKVKEEVIKLCNNPYSNENLFNEDNFRVEENQNGYVLHKNNITMNLYSPEAPVDFDIIAPYQDSDPNYIVEDLFTTFKYGFVLNENNGNEAYKAALDNVYFRKSLFALLEQEKTQYYSYNPNISSYLGSKEVNFKTISNIDESLKSVEIKEGINEAKALYQQALNSGLSQDTIEVFVTNPVLNKDIEKVNYLNTVFNDVYNEKVKITLVTKPLYYSYNYVEGTEDFYNEIQLRGNFYYSLTDTFKNIFTL